MSALPVLIVTREGEMLKSLPLESDVSIGRAEGNVIRLDDRAVSRNHALVRKTPEGVQIEKQSDFAPIRLNGVECTRAFLKEGDVVEIGPFRMRLDQKKGEKKAEKKEERREEKKEEVPSESPLDFKPVLEDATRFVPSESPVVGGEPTVALFEEEMQRPEALPTESEPITLDMASGTGTEDATAQVDKNANVFALPIQADEKGADSASTDPGTNIFNTPQGEDPNAIPALNIDFNLNPVDHDTNTAGTAETPSTASRFDENAATRVIPTSVDARLDIPDGMANLKSLDLDKSEIYIGRGKECDLVLNDKKSSRKNSMIAKVGNRYVLHDLDSSNGTYVNGNPIKQHELSADDVIRIGEVEIRFVALNPDYDRKKSSFLPVDPGPSSAPFAALGPNPPNYGPFEGQPGAGYPGAAIPPAAAAPAARKGIWGAYDKYFRNFGSLKPLQKLLVLLSVGLFLSWYFEEELGLVDQPQVAQQQVKKAGDGKPVVANDYDRLPPEKRAQIDDAVRKATDFLRQMDYDKAIYEIQQKVYPILPDYSQAKEIERYAQEGKRRKEAIAEEARKKEEEEKLRIRIAELEKQTQDFMAQKKYEQAKETFSEILTLDPENAQVSEWKKEIDAWMEEQARIEQERLVQEEINKRAWDTYREGFELHKAGKYREAIASYKKVPELGTNDEALLKKVRTMIKTSEDSLKDLRDPHLKKAKELEASSDLAGAFKEFQAATEVDPSHGEGWAGMDRIRDVLNERAKVLYVEAVIAESYSDFKTAHTKFGEIMKLAPEGSLYYQRAQRKLQYYLTYKADEEASPQ